MIKRSFTKLRLLSLICVFCTLLTACSGSGPINWETWDPNANATGTSQTSGSGSQGTEDPDVTDPDVNLPTFILQNGEWKDGAILGNPIVLSNTVSGPLSSLTLSGGSASTRVTVCGKNLFRIKEDQVDRQRNNISFDFNPEKGSISVTTDGATSSTLASATSAVLNGKSTSGVMYSFRFPVDTLITVSANCNDAYTYRQDVYLQIVDGTSINRETGEGYTFIAKANTDYGIRLFVREGVVCNDLVFRPQIEIGGCKTSFEIYNGITTQVAGSQENILSISPSFTTEYYHAEKADCVFNHQTKTFYVSAREPSSAVICYDKTNDQMVNGKDTYYLQKFSFDTDTAVTVSGIDPAHADKVRLQITDGSSIIADRGNGVTFVAKAHTEYALRIYVAANASFDSLAIKPVIATGIYALSTTANTTTIFTNDASTISLTLPATIKTPEAVNRKPMITFIDDDTTKAEYVKIFHDIFAAKGVNANYAVVTRQLEKSPELLSLLKQYEQEGFGMLYHCDYQNGDETLYWQHGENRDMQKAIENFEIGLAKMEAFGFSDYKYWVSPYGVYDAAMQNMAKDHGMECLISYNKNSFISDGGNCSRFNIPRYSLSATDNSSITRIEDAIDACCMENGWIIVTTHVNEWNGQYDEMSAKVSALLQYALDNDMEVVTFAEGYEKAQDWFQN